VAAVEDRDGGDGTGAMESPASADTLLSGLPVAASAHARSGAGGDRAQRMLATGIATMGMFLAGSALAYLAGTALVLGALFQTRNRSGAAVQTIALTREPSAARRR
jgi:hypothetical protein